MGHHGSGYDLGWFGEWTYRVFRRLPDWLGFTIPFVIFIGVLETGELLLLHWRGSVAWLRPDSEYQMIALVVVPLIAFAIAIMFFEMALLTGVTRSGRWKLLHLQNSMREVRSLPPREFERLVGAAYEQQGYRIDYAGEGKDGGIDLVMRRGSDRILVQCKNWYRALTGVSEIRELFGVLTGERAGKAMFVTSGVFSEDAIAFAKGKPLELIDGQALLEMIEAIQESERPFSDGHRSLPRVDVDLNHDKLCPICQAPTIRKTATRGRHAGNSFWSCSRVPKCMGIAPD